MDQKNSPRAGFEPETSGFTVHRSTICSISLLLLLFLMSPDKSYVVELQIICLYSQTGNSKCFEASFASVDGASVDAS